MRVKLNVDEFGQEGRKDDLMEDDLYLIIDVMIADTYP